MYVTYVSSEIIQLGTFIIFLQASVYLSSEFLFYHARCHCSTAHTNPLEKGQTLPNAKKLADRLQPRHVKVPFLSNDFLLPPPLAAI